MDKELIEAFVLECKQEQEFQIRWNAAHIKFENYFKYSGEIEKTKKMSDHYYIAKYGMFLKTFSSEPMDPVVRYYFQNPNLTLIELGIKFNICYKEASKKISEYLKTKINEKNEKIFA